MTTHVGELIDGFLLGALEPHEEVLVREHVLDCAACVDLLADSRAVLATLPEALAPMTPSPSVKAGLLARVEADRREPVAVKTSAPARTTNKFGPAQWALAAAAGLAVAAVVGSFIWAVTLNNRLDDRERQLAETQRAIEALVRSDQTLHMESEYAGQAVEASIAVPEAGTAITLVVTGLPPSRAGEEYRLWLYADGQPEAGLFLEPDGSGSVVANLDLDLSRYEEMELDAQSVDATAPGGEFVIGGALR